MVGFWIVIILAFAVLITSLANEKIRKILVRVICALIIFWFVGFAFFFYQIIHSTKWKEISYSDSIRANVSATLLDDTMADVLEICYIRGFQDVEYWYQSGWFGTIDELASQLTFESEDLKQEFIDSITQSSDYKEASSSGLNKLSYIKGRTVLLYEFDPQVLGIETKDDRIDYYILIDQATNEASLAIDDNSDI